MSNVECSDWRVPVQAVAVGTKLVCDGGFTCLDDGEICTVCVDDDGWLYVNCRGDEPEQAKNVERHYLDGQMDDELAHYVGFRLAARLSQEGE